METLAFDVRGDYALFKKPYSPMSPVSYPFPPPSAVLGMLGAVGGYDKEGYAESLGWRKARVAVKLLAPVQVFGAALNLLNTKDGTDAFFRPKADRNTHIQVPCEFLRSVAYRIYVADLEPEACDRIGAQLEAGRTTYSVALGWASCLADLDWVGLSRAQALRADDREWSCDTVVPLDRETGVIYEDRRRYRRLRVPAAMDGKRIVHRYQEAVMAEDGGPIRGHGGQDGFYRIGDETLAFL
jgi:CRISPR-associated protein Cas5h